MYAQEMSLRDIAKSFKTDHHTIKRWLNRSGVETKPRNTAIFKGYPCICLNCNKEFFRKGRARKDQYRFCGQPCYRIFNNHREGQMSERACIQCSLIYKPTKNSQKHCGRKCFEVSHKYRMSGDKNPAWLDGRSKDPSHTFYRADNWDEIKRLVYKRDKFTCQKCFEKCVPRNRNNVDTRKLIQCHHILPFIEGGGNDLENLETLCISCHRAVHNYMKYGR